MLWWTFLLPVLWGFGPAMEENSRVLGLRLSDPDVCPLPDHVGPRKSSRASRSMAGGEGDNADASGSQSKKNNMTLVVSEKRRNKTQGVACGVCGCKDSPTYMD